MSNESELAGNRSKRSAGQLRTTIHISVPFPTELIGTSIRGEPPKVVTEQPKVVTETIAFVVHPYRQHNLHDMLEAAVHINISAELLNFKPAEEPKIEPDVTKEPKNKASVDEDAENEAEQEPKTPEKHPSKPVTLIPNVNIRITPAVLCKEVFLSVKEGKAYKIQKGGRVLASVLYPKVKYGITN